VEYMLVAMDHNSHKVRLVLSAGDVLHALQEKGENTNPNHPTLWRPEYGSYMIEGTPGQPYGGTMSEFNTVEDNMGKRRREASSLLKENQTLCTITAFPRYKHMHMALSAASPFYRGYVSDNDCRWGVISASVDDRTREERGLEPLKHNKYRISKSRYDSIDSYLSSCGEKYNDIELTIDEEINKQLLEAGVDRLVAQHVAHLFIRDPLVVLEETIHQDDENESEHFEVQLTDFENSAYVVFVVLLTRVILSYKLDFLIPLSKVRHIHIDASHLKNMNVSGRLLILFTVIAHCISFTVKRKPFIFEEQTTDAIWQYFDQLNLLYLQYVFTASAPKRERIVFSFVYFKLMPDKHIGQIRRDL
ncbi:UNVERIFIED_CONTAM: hypothetical protein FKN15_077647, partial [Acipenser sinensis]